MNDLDQLREFRAEIPYPERPRLSPGRSRLLSAARRPQRRRFTATRRTTLLLTATAAATAVAVAAGLAGYGLSTGNAPAGHARQRLPSHPKAVPSQAVLAARVLRDASAAASRVPPKTTPSPGQWIYSKLVGYQYPQGTTSDDELDHLRRHRECLLREPRRPDHRAHVARDPSGGHHERPAGGVQHGPHPADRVLRPGVAARRRRASCSPRSTRRRSPSARRTSPRATRSRAKRQRTRASSSSTTCPCCCGTRRAAWAPRRRQRPRRSARWPPSPA